MKIYAISDLHLSFLETKPMDIFGDGWKNHWSLIVEDWKNKVTDEDIVLVAGDISWAMTLEEAQADLERIGACKGKIILIRGNHDYWWSSMKKINSILPDNMVCLQNNAVKIGNYVFCGSRGWTVPELGAKPTADDTKLYERERLRMEMSLMEGAKLKQEGDTLIAMIHFPPFNSRAESSYFTELFQKYGVSHVIYGHIHGKTSRARLYYEKNNIKYYLTSCDQVNNKLVEII